MHRQRYQSAIYRRRGVRGQSLVEYALALVLVAGVVIVAAALLGLGAQKIFGVAAGSMGARTSNPTGGGQRYVNISSVVCQKRNVTSQIRLWVRYATNIPAAQLTGMANVRIISSASLTCSSTNCNWYPIFVNSGGTYANCPTGVAIQSNTGQIAVYPVMSYGTY